MLKRRFSTIFRTLNRVGGCVIPRKNYNSSIIRSGRVKITPNHMGSICQKNQLLYQDGNPASEACLVVYLLASLIMAYGAP
jgi:hypothetical protein